MKRLLPLVILISVIFTLASPPAFALEADGRAQPEINAPAAILMEKETGTVLYEKNAHEPGFPASITKIMTMLLIVEDIEAGRLRLDDTVIASERAASFGGSCVYLEAGEQMSVSDMLKCIAVVSANDCAVAMAEHIRTITTIRWRFWRMCASTAITSGSAGRHSSTTSANRRASAGTTISVGRSTVII